MLSSIRFQSTCKACVANKPLGANATNPAYLKAQLFNYYQAIDKQDLQTVNNLFDNNAQYYREGWPALLNKLAIIDFFKTKRRLRGAHHVQSLSPFDETQPTHGFNLKLPKGPKFHAKGQFHGVLDGLPIHLGFEDLWVFNPQNAKVIYRQTLIHRL